MMSTFVRMIELSSCPNGVGYSVPPDINRRLCMNNMFMTKLIVCCDVLIAICVYFLL